MRSHLAFTPCRYITDCNGSVGKSMTRIRNEQVGTFLPGSAAVPLGKRLLA